MCQLQHIRIVIFVHIKCVRLQCQYNISYVTDPLTFSSIVKKCVEFNFFENDLNKSNSIHISFHSFPIKKFKK